MGVDLFFILSGFLIANILLKEADKNDGQIGYGKFLLGRVTRLIFVIIPYAIFWGVFTKSAITGFAAVTFTTNFIGDVNHLWSVSMEMQFYMVSPCIMMYLYKEKNPLTIASVIGIFSVVSTLGIAYQSCPNIFKHP